MGQQDPTGPFRAIPATRGWVFAASMLVAGCATAGPGTVADDAPFASAWVFRTSVRVVHQYARNPMTTEYVNLNGRILFADGLVRVIRGSATCETPDPGGTRQTYRIRCDRAEYVLTRAGDRLSGSVSLTVEEVRQTERCWTTHAQRTCSYDTRLEPGRRSGTLQLQPVIATRR